MSAILSWIRPINSMRRCEMLASCFLPIAAFGLSLSGALAGGLETEAGGSTTWQAGVNGPQIEFDKAGGIVRIFSKFSQPVTLSDRRGIQTATIIAEEKAKAEIVRFLSQDVASGRVVTEIESDLSNAVQASTKAGKTNSQIDQRAIVQNVTEVTKSAAAGRLIGVVVLESGYDEKAQEVWVVVGISQKTIGAAGAVMRMMTDPPASLDGSPSGQTAPDVVADPYASRPTDGPHIPSEIRRGNSDF